LLIELEYGKVVELYINTSQFIMITTEKFMIRT